MSDWFRSIPSALDSLTFTVKVEQTRSVISISITKGGNPSVPTRGYGVTSQIPQNEAPATSAAYRTAQAGQRGVEKVGMDEPAEIGHLHENNFFTGRTISYKARTNNYFAKWNSLTVTRLPSMNSTLTESDNGHLSSYKIIFQFLPYRIAL